MDTLKNLVLKYFVIGLCIGTYSWWQDPSHSADTLVAILIIAVIWPLWLYLHAVFG